MKLTITGFTGFVGQNLLQHLKNFDITPLSIRYSSNQTINLGASEAVIHLAGKAHDLKKVSQLSDYYEANYELTKQLYDAFLKSEAKKFIFISSVKAVIDSVNGVLTEKK